MGDDRPGSYTCNRCGGFWEAAPADAEADGEVQCQQCGSTEVAPFDPHAAPYHHQPNPELLHLQFLTPRPPVAPGAMVAMGPYMPFPRPTSPPARWAEDPTGRNQWRWWGGSRWTDHVANDGAATTDPLD